MSNQKKKNAGEIYSHCQTRKGTKEGQRKRRVDGLTGWRGASRWCPAGWFQWTWSADPVHRTHGWGDTRRVTMTMQKETGRTSSLSPTGRRRKQRVCYCSNHRTCVCACEWARVCVCVCVCTCRKNMTSVAIPTQLCREYISGIAATLWKLNTATKPRHTHTHRGCSK